MNFQKKKQQLVLFLIALFAFISSVMGTDKKKDLNIINGAGFSYAIFSRDSLDSTTWTSGSSNLKTEKKTTFLQEYRNFSCFVTMIEHAYKLVCIKDLKEKENAYKKLLLVFKTKKPEIVNQLDQPIKFEDKPIEEVVLYVVNEYARADIGRFTPLKKKYVGTISEVKIDDGRKVTIKMKAPFIPFVRYSFETATLELKPLKSDYKSVTRTHTPFKTYSNFVNAFFYFRILIDMMIFFLLLELIGTPGSA